MPKQFSPADHVKLSNDPLDGPRDLLLNQMAEAIMVVPYPGYVLREFAFDLLLTVTANTIVLEGGDPAAILAKLASQLNAAVPLVQTGIDMAKAAPSAGRRQAGNA